MSGIDETHDPRRESWVTSANGHTEFPIQNLPFGVFSPPGGAPRGGIAIGDMVFDLAAALEARLFTGESEKAAEAAAGSALNPLMALGAPGATGIAQTGFRIARRRYCRARQDRSDGWAAVASRRPMHAASARRDRRIH